MRVFVLAVMKGTGVTGRPAPDKPCSEARCGE